MKNAWVLTTGSSDVQLTSDENWPDWYSNIKKDIDNLKFKPARAIDEESQPYRLPARVLSAAYNKSPDQVQPYLTFPLLKNFIEIFKTSEIQIDHIIVLVSDQENIFSEDDRQQPHSPYWQDTCQIYPILEKCLQGNFPNATIQQISLKPSNSPGLDDWDAVLNLVQIIFQNLKLPSDLQNVYVSYQAGTPAISSAVQFISLSNFGEQVKFLVSNEYDSSLTRILDSSRYLRGIRKKECQRLLERYDYSGVQSIIGEKELASESNQELKTLLTALIQWNCTEFAKFNSTLMTIDDELLKSNALENSVYWSWMAFEEVYLAKVRKEQGNIIEAFFHSFRAFEGVFAAWGGHEFIGHIDNYKGVPHLLPSVLDNAKDFFSDKSCKNVSDLKNLKGVLQALKDIPPENQDKDEKCKTELNFATLCKLFRAYRYKDYKAECPELKIFWESDKEKRVSEKRNLIVHQIQGMPESTLWEYWGVSSEKEWQERLLKLLNFITEKSFTSLEEASIMSAVHKKLQAAVDRW